GWGNRRLLLGALAGGAAAAAASLAVAGLSAAAGFLAATGNPVLWNLHYMVGVAGISGSYLGNGTAAILITDGGALVACGCCFWLGRVVRADSRRLDAAFCAAAVLSLLGAPHAYLHDITMLAPVSVIALAAAMRSSCTAPLLRSWPAAVLGLWLLINAAAFVDFNDGHSMPPGALTAYALLAAAIVAAGAARIRYRAHREAAVGALADGLRERRNAERVGLLSV
ncbi:MAG: hypothetical protein JOY80_12115, partial [Candidatus Dormibacteraeota bacterium]|nr:hypothetical protein [Candidatus Dormibacteraeota bacterium]